MSSSPNEEKPEFVFTVKAQDGAGHSVGITRDGIVYTWGKSNAMGQLGRGVGKSKTPLPAEFSHDGLVHAIRAFAGGGSDAGHTAVLDSSGNLWLAGCDRWQQLGLGSPSGGAGGYTWVGGKIQQTTFQRNDFVTDLLRKYDTTARIRDVALGGDHSIVLSSNKRDVITFGKGGDGQLGLSQKAFLSAPAKSAELSSSRAEVAAVCAINYCSLTLNNNGDVLKHIGKCRSQAQSFADALSVCRDRSRRAGLIRRESQMK